MSETTFEEAKRCPKCNEPGQEAGSRSQRGGGEIKTIYCRNPRCAWNDTSWIVQVNADGSIPDPTLVHDKSFAKVPDRTDAIQSQMNRLYQQTITPGGEIRN